MNISETSHVPSSAVQRNASASAAPPIGQARGPSIAPSAHGYLPLVQPPDRVVSGRKLNVLCPPSRRVLEHAFMNAQAVEDLQRHLEMAAGSLEARSAIQQAPGEALEYLAWTGSLGEHGHAVVDAELDDRHRAAKTLAGKTDAELDAVIAGTTGALPEVARNEKARRAEVKRLESLVQAYPLSRVAVPGRAYQQRSGAELKRLAEAPADRVTTETRAAALKEWDRRRADPDSIVNMRLFGAPLAPEVADYGHLHSNELKALINKLNGASLHEAEAELQEWPDEALTLLKEHFTVLPHVQEVVAQESDDRTTRARELARLPLRELVAYRNATTGTQRTLAERELNRRVEVALLNVQGAGLLASGGSGLV